MKALSQFCVVITNFVAQWLSARGSVIGRFVATVCIVLVFAHFGLQIFFGFMQQVNPHSYERRVRWEEYLQYLENTRDALQNYKLDRAEGLIRATNIKYGRNSNGTSMLHELRQKQGRMREVYEIERDERLKRRKQSGERIEDPQSEMQFALLAESVGETKVASKIIKGIADQALAKKPPDAPMLRTNVRSEKVDRVLALIYSKGMNGGDRNPDNKLYVDAMKLLPNNAPIMIYAAMHYWPEENGKATFGLLKKAYEVGAPSDKKWISEYMEDAFVFNLKELLSGEYLNYFKH